MTTLFCTILYTVHPTLYITVLFVCIVLSVYTVCNYCKYERAVRHQKFPTGLIKYLPIYLSIYLSVRVFVDLLSFRLSDHIMDCPMDLILLVSITGAVCVRLLPPSGAVCVRQIGRASWRE